MIGVVVVNYNSGEVLSRCIRALFASDVAVSVTVVDNASRDDSLARLERLSSPEWALDILRNARNLGFAKACNQGAGGLDAKYIAFVNPDCIVREDTLRILRQSMDDHGEAGLAGGMISDETGGEQVATRRRIPTPWSSLMRVLHLGRLFPKSRVFLDFNLAAEPLPENPASVEATSGALMFVRRAALEDVGMLDEGYFLHCEDLDWMMRFRQAGWQVLFVPQAVAVHIQGTCSRTRPVRVLWHKHRSMLRFYRKFYRTRYPAGLFVLVSAAVWTRFAVLAVAATLRRRAA